MSVSLWSEETSEVLRGPGVCRKRVVEGLLQLEEKYLPSPLYSTLIQRDPDTREALAKWTLEVCREHRCAESVFLLAVSLLDRYLSTSLSLPVSPTCLTAACILIASKLIDNKADMESIVLATLRWDVATVTASDFLPHFLSALSENEDGQRTGHTEGFLSSVRSLSDTLVALCVCDAHLLGTPPSLVAAAALSSACRALGNKAPEMDTITTLLAGLCQTEKVVVQYYSELIDSISTERLRSREKQVWDLDGDKQDEEVKDDRAGTPTDLREIQF
ncbi:G1/S-specific cyclin-D2-like [Scleropages formosus]|uniref:G1/S-specific cyclin-D2-like n=1 Tax=Scleropages formosus TaxID=113540 RepID=A0A0P7TNJ6_SCLFO|nr:G1/S-specific cyclin-D2-like [Scleropages formosus]